MPNVVQVLAGKSMGTFSAYPVFDVLIKESLYTASLTFRSKKIFPHPPGTVVCCFQATKTPFVVEEISYESNGISEVSCVSVWEMLKRRNKCMTYENLYPTTFQPLGILPIILDHINTDPKRWFVYWLKCSLPTDNIDYVDNFDPSTSVYDDVYNAAVYNQLYFSSQISVTKNNSINVDVWLMAKSLNQSNGIFDLGPLDSVTARVTRRLPPSPTHWAIGKTSDSGMWKISSRGTIHTWYENHAYMYNSAEWQGAYRYETAIQGGSDQEWGQITRSIRCEPLKSVSVEIDEIPSDKFGRMTIGQVVSGTVAGLMFTGYVVERTVSGGDLTTYSAKVQPDRFYENGVEVTNNWI